MEIIDLNIDANVVVPETVNVSGEVRANPINAGVTSIVINGVEQEIDQGQVSFSVPTKVSDVENDLGFIDREVNDLTNYPRTNQLSEVAFSGSYDDLENKPVIPDVPNNVSAFTNDVGYITKDVNNLENYSKTNELSQVAFSGNYADLSNKPQIPSKTIVEVNAIQTTGVKIAEITVDGQSTDIYADQGGGGGTNVSVTETLSSGTKVANILVDGQDNNIYVPTIPSNVSSFNNDAGYLTSSDLSGFATTTYVDNGLATKQDVIDSSNKLPASNVSGLATVATTGSYNDLSNKPDLSVYAESSSLATVATSGSYNDLENKPSIPTVPTNVSSFNNDSGYITKDVNDLTNYTTTSNLATVATSGDYDDLENKPTIPVVPTNVSSFTNDSGYITKSVNNLDNYTPTSSLSSVATSGAYSDLSGTPDLSIYAQSANLATVATSGDYEDLSNKPTIPSAVQTDTSSATSVTIAADHMTKMSSTAVSSITCTVTSDTTQIHEWAGKFTTGANQTSVTIAMSDSATIEWASSPANLISGTKYAFSITGNATVGYNGTIVPFLY